MFHDVTLTRASNGATIPCGGLTLSVNAQAWAWSVDAVLIGTNAAASIEPEGTDPVILHAEVDGLEFQFLIDDWNETWTFGKRALSVTGAGLTAQLAAPYYLPATFTSSQARTVPQLIEQELPLSGEWTSQWEAESSPLIPAGAWSYQNMTPIQAISALAQSSGCMVVPPKAVQQIIVRPRYPVLPWDYASADPDLTIPAGWTRIRSRYAPRRPGQRHLSHRGQRRRLCRPNPTHRERRRPLCDRGAGQPHDRHRHPSAPRPSRASAPGPAAGDRRAGYAVR